MLVSYCHIVINENKQIINLWLSAEVTNVLDNALITMEYLYKTGIVNVHLEHLKDEKSYFNIEYSVDKLQTLISQKFNSVINEEVGNDIEQEHRNMEKNKITLCMAEVDDHKRQLTFCNIDLQQNMVHTKILLNEQLKLLKVIEKVYLTLLKLERSGHPNYQLKKATYNMFDEGGELKLVYLLKIS